MTRSEQLNKAKKLRELARRGVGGEMENAKAMLENFKTKYSITDADMDGHKYSESFAFAGMKNEEFDFDTDSMLDLLIRFAKLYAETKFRKR